MALTGEKRCFIPRPIELKDLGSGLVIAVAPDDLDTFVEAFGQRRIPDVVWHQVLSIHPQHPSPRDLVVNGPDVSVWLTLSADTAVSSKNVRSWRSSSGVEPIITEHREAAMFKNSGSLINDDNANNNVVDLS